MSLNIRLDRIFPGMGVSVRNDTQYLRAGIALSGTPQQTSVLPATGIILPTTAGRIRVKIYNGGGTTPTFTDLVVNASDGTNTVIIGPSLVHPASAIGLTATQWFEYEFEYLLDTAASGAGGGATGQLSGVVGGATSFNILTTMGGTSPTASMDVEICPLI